MPKKTGSLPRRRKFNGKTYKLELGGYTSKGRAHEVCREDYRSKGHAARVVESGYYYDKEVPHTWTNARTGEKRRGTKTAKIYVPIYHVYYREKK